jgi:FixJ family two-component response regulator
VRSERSLKTWGALVSIVDDDVSMRESLPHLLKLSGYESNAFSSAEDFLTSDCVSQARCLILDIAMPGMSGLDLQQEMARRGFAIPIIFITACRDENLRPHVLAQGAKECLVKPFSASALINALKDALK